MPSAAEIKAQLAAAQEACQIQQEKANAEERALGEQLAVIEQAEHEEAERKAAQKAAATAEAAWQAEIEQAQLAKEQEDAENRWKAEEEKSLGQAADDEDDIRLGETLVQSVHRQLKAMGKEQESSGDKVGGKKKLAADVKIRSKIVSWVGKSPFLSFRGHWVTT